MSIADQRAILDTPEVDETDYPPIGISGWKTGGKGRRCKNRRGFRRYDRRIRDRDDNAFLLEFDEFNGFQGDSPAD
jgi:hypothetical protein